MRGQHTSSAGGSPAPPPLAVEAVGDYGRKRSAKNVELKTNLKPKPAFSIARENARPRPLQIRTKPLLKCANVRGLTDEQCGTPLPAHEYGFSSFRQHFSWKDGETGKLCRSTMTRFQIRRVDVEPEALGAKTCFRTTYKTFDPGHSVWYTTASIFADIDTKNGAASPGSPVRKAMAIDELEGFTFHLSPRRSSTRSGSARQLLFSH